MSADLWAEFGQASGAAQSSGGPTQTARPVSRSLIDGVDQSGDFFFGIASKVPIQAAAPTQPYDRRVESPSIHRPPAAIRQAVTRPQPAVFNLPPPHDSDVLFDAAEDTPAGSSDDDEWGEFAGPETSATQPHQLAHLNTGSEAQTPASQHISGAVDLLGELSISDSIVTSDVPVPSPPNDPSSQSGWNDDSFGDWGDFTEAQPVQSNPSEAPTKSSLTEKDSIMEWDDFTDGAPAPARSFEPNANRSYVQASPSKKLPSPTTKASAVQSRNVSKPQSAKESKSQAANWDEDSFEDWADFNDEPEPKRPQVHSASTPRQAQSSRTTTVTTSTPSMRTSTPTSAASSSTVRPTNIPPPSILLEHLLSLLSTIAKEAQTAQARPASQREHAAAKIQNTLHSAARIIAGRTYRWKRDTILAQSMRIGPARAGKSGGMKLNAVNKHENVKEEQDAVDLLALWRERASVFNAVVQSVGLKPIPAVPNPTALRVFTARADHGAIKATHPCALCALKRDERVAKVDEEEVQDSFGEWWTDHWGHTGCRIFWEENRGLLMQR
ncbi:hypothetical protein POX_b02712 [Penicillium oxalicum]|uniref:hypothetical protein n=1 Tax=Penicillium oxalicum TaxID=69781 RepID=UPI0020B6B173|nr:hypothetical protein POX_b02712 [Penicillium oxalicum]KAI2792672.1 hypothetical protein POX_b02712 [Penicillium oxalicum]